MAWGEALKVHAWLAGGWLAALLLCAPASAQNAAEGNAKPPPPSSADASANSADAPANSADAAAAQDATAGNAAEGPAQPPDKPQDKTSAKPPAKPKVKPGAKGNAATGSAAPAGKPAAGAAPGAPPNSVGPTPPPPAAGAKSASSAAPNAAEGNVGPAAPEVGPQPPATGAGSSAGPVGPAAPGGVHPPALPGSLPAPPGTNAAESRPQGSSGGVNSADALNKPAEPAVPSDLLPTPSEAAGSATGYIAPEMSLNVPGIDALTPPAPIDSFQQPTRDYLQTRPLPTPDQKETDEAKVARDIEESLKQIELSKEHRTNELPKLPLTNGAVYFKAADSFTYDRKNRILTFTGSTQLYFGNLLVAADYIQVDDGAATAYAKGYVMIQQNDEVVYADEAYINYDTGHLELFNVEGNTGGTRLTGGVDWGKRGPNGEPILTGGVVYFTSDHVFGTWDDMIMQRCTVTTCDPFCGETREVHLSASKIVYKRDRSIVLHNVHVFLRTHKVAWTPLLAFPLVKQKQRFNQEQTKIQQDYGYDTQNGWFAKFAYTYYTHYVEKAQATLLGVARVDLVENFGPDIGIRQDFFIPALGVTSISGDYQRDWPAAFAHTFLGRKTLTGTKNFEFHLKQELNLSHNLRGNLTSDRVNKFFPSGITNGAGSRTDTWNSNFNLAYSHNNTSSSLTGSQSIATTGGQTDASGNAAPRSQSVNSSAGFSYSQTLVNPGQYGHHTLKFKLDDQYTANKGGGTTSGIPADQEGTFDTTLEYNYADRGTNPAAPTNGQSTSIPGPSTSGTPTAPGAPGTSGATAVDQPVHKPTSPFDGLHAILTYKDQGIDYDKDHNTRDNNNQISKSLPELSIDLPRDLINDHAYFTQFNVDLGELVTGRRRAPQSSFRVDLNASGSGSMHFSRGALLNSQTRLEQFWYDDGNSQYNINQNLSYTYDDYRGFQFNSAWALNFRQGVREPPVSTDRRIYSQTLSYGTVLTNYRSWRWQLQSGYNLATDRHNPLSSTFSWAPNKTFSFIHSTSYDIENTNWAFSSFQGSFRSTYLDPTGVYNWVFNTEVSTDTNYWDKWAITQLQMSYFRRYERGWSAEVIGGSRVGTIGDKPPDFTEKFLRSMVKAVTVRKVNCCTTLEGSWTAESHTFDLKLYLNALPQYPGTLDDSRGQQTVSSGVGSYIYRPQFLFPTDNLRTDILQDMFGISSTGASF